MDLAVETSEAQQASGVGISGLDQPDPAAMQGMSDILGAIASLSKRLERLRAAQARSAGLRTPSYNLLVIVDSYGDHGTTVSEAALKLGVRPQGLSASVAELVQAGFLQRAKDSTDGRARRLRITERGQDLLNQASVYHQRLSAEMLKQVPHPAVAKLVLSRLDAAFRQVLREA